MSENEYKRKRMDRKLNASERRVICLKIASEKRMVPLHFPDFMGHWAFFFNSLSGIYIISLHSVTQGNVERHGDQR